MATDFSATKSGIFEAFQLESQNVRSSVNRETFGGASFGLTADKQNNFELIFYKQFFIYCVQQYAFSPVRVSRLTNFSKPSSMVEALFISRQMSINGS